MIVLTSDHGHVLDHETKAGAVTVNGGDRYRLDGADAGEGEIKISGLRILQATLTRVNGSLPAGSVVDGADGVTVMCGQGALLLQQVQPAGGKAMVAGDWRRGLRTLPVLGTTTPSAE
jgi:methionyl-tRNA formyltransferase